MNKISKINDIDQIDNYGFGAWECNDKALKNRAVELVSKLRFLLKEGFIDDEMYFCFLNNKYESLMFDDIRIYDKNQEYLCGISPYINRNNNPNKCHFYRVKGGYKLYEFTSWSEFKKQLLDDKRLNSEIRQIFNKEEK